MRTGCNAFAEKLAPRFAALSERIEEQVLSEMLSGGDTFCSYHFEIDGLTIQNVVGLFQGHSRLWADFERAVQAFRKTTHWAMLLEHVYQVGKLLGKLRLLEQGLADHAAEDRRRLADHLNALDGEIAFCQELADRRNLAGQINEAAGFAIMDGLTLRGLTYVLGERPDLWQDLQGLVESSIMPNEAGSRPGMPYGEP
jgi:hypothetical protein